MGGNTRRLLADACADLALSCARPGDAGVALDDVAATVAQILRLGSSGLVLGDSVEDLQVGGSTDAVVAALLATEQSAGSGPARAAYSEGTVVIAPTLIDVAERWPAWEAEARAQGVGAWLTVPSRMEEVVVVVSAGSTRPRRWHDDEVAAAQLLADLAAGWVARDRELARVRRTAVQLQQALDRRLVIEQAKGILAGELHCSLDRAFGILREHARHNSVAVRVVAQAVVELGLRPLPDRGSRRLGDAEVS